MRLPSTASRLALAGALLVLAPAAAGAAEAVAYAGTIGDLSVGVELLAPETAGGPVYGRYFYLSQGGDIPLHPGEGAGEGALALREEKPCTPALCQDAEGMTLDLSKAPLGAEWRLSGAPGDETLAGTWRAAPGQPEMEVRLGRVGARTTEVNPDLPFDALDATSALWAGDVPQTPSAATLPYDVLKMDAPLEAGREERFGEGTYVMERDTRTGVRYPAVISLGEGVDVGPVNEGLFAARFDYTIPSFSCLSSAYLGFGWSGYDAQGGQGYEDGGNVEVEYLTQRLVGVFEAGSFWCGGAHPDNYIDHRFVDARSGEAVELETLLKGWTGRDENGAPIDPGTPPDAGPAFVTYGPDEELAAFVKARRQRFDGETEANCGYDDLVENSLGLYVKDDALVFTLKDLPFAIVACTDDLLSVPIKQARPLLTDKGASYFAELD